MIQILKNTKVNFIGNRNYAFGFSGVLILITIISLFVRGGLNYSIDFAGGTLIQLKFEKSIVADLGKVRAIVDGLAIGSSEIKTIGRESDNTIQITVKKKAEGTLVGDEIRDAIAISYAQNPFIIQKDERVGPKIGGEMRSKGFWIIMLSFLALIIYLGFRFSLPYGVAAIIATMHDVIITIGLFSVLNLEVSLTIVVALLTLAGYSMNDTIVVFDRIRENVGKTLSNNKTSFEDKVNTSINQTLSRTIITSFLTFLAAVVIFAVFFFTEDVIKWFALAFGFGVAIGTYSSIFVASPIIVLWNKKWPVHTAKQ